MGRRHRTNNYIHPIHAKIGTHAWTVIYVDLKTAVAAGTCTLRPGDRVRFRCDDSPDAELLTGVVAPETSGRVLFISLQ